MAIKKNGSKTVKQGGQKEKSRKSIQQRPGSAYSSDILPVYEALLSMEEDLYFVLSKELLIQYNTVNSAHKLGYETEELRQAPFSRLLPSEVHKQFTAFLEHLSETHGDSVELPMQNKAGQLFPAKVFLRQFNWNGEQAIAVRIKDVSLEKRFNIERNMLSHALKNVKECLSVFDLAGNIIFVNDAFQETYGYAGSELIGQPIDKFHPAAANESLFKKIIDQTIPDGWEGELQARRKNGKPFTLALRTSAVQDDEGNPLVIIGVGSDVTEMKLLEEQLRQSQKIEAIGQLAGGIAHDFNNLLTVIEGYLELLISSTMPNDPTHNFVQQIKKATERAASLTSQLLAFSKSQILQPKNIDLNDLINNMSALFQRLISEDIELTFDLDRDIDQIKADPSQIEQILMNMVVNARDAMPEGGSLSIETRQVYLDGQYLRMHNGVKKGQYVLLAITDTGMGMDKETQKRIFEPFFTTKGKAKGTGLGLSTVYGIVKQSEGHLWVYSEPGLGTTFKIYLPAYKEDVRREKEPDKEEKPLGGNETILVVEDEYLVRELVCDTLQNSGYTILEAANGKEALEIYHSNQQNIDLILTDVIMPEMSGRKLVETLAEKYPGLKSLYMSGYTDDAIIRHGVLEPGMNYIQKPFSPRSLLKKINEVLNK